MKQTKQPRFYYLLWILTFFASGSFFIAYSNYQQQLTEVGKLKEQLKNCPFIEQDNLYACTNTLKLTIPQADSTPLFFVGGLTIAIFVLSLYQTFSPPVQPPKPADEDFIKVFIGRKHSDDILGEVYHIGYLYKEKGVEPSLRYLISILDELIRRVGEHYHLSPASTPGDGPLPYDPKQHVSSEHIMPNEDVWIAEAGWKKEDQLILPNLVSKNPTQYLEGDWE